MENVLIADTVSMRETTDEEIKYHITPTVRNPHPPTKKQEERKMHRSLILI